MACRLLFRLFVGPRGRGGQTSSPVALIKEATGWLDVVCSGSLLLRPGGDVRDVRDRRSSETVNGACCRGAEYLGTIGGVGLRRLGGRHEECADGRRSLHGYGVDERTRDEAPKTQGLIM